MLGWAPVATSKSLIGFSSFFLPNSIQTVHDFPDLMYQQKTLTNHWKITTSPKFKNKTMVFGAKRPFKVKPDCFLQLKMGQTDLAMFF
jgi:hypothetical protein